MSVHRRKQRLFESSLVKEALGQSFIKLNPRIMIRNPIMFTVEICTAVMLAVCIWIITGEKTQGGLVYNIIVFVVLLLTLLFANFAEAIAEARGKAQADSLRKTRQDTPAKWIQAVGEIFTNEIKIVPSSQLRKGDIFFCEAGDTIPMDGEIIEGIATIDESAITGESAPMIRESGGDKSSVTGRRFIATTFSYHRGAFSCDGTFINGCNALNYFSIHWYCVTCFTKENVSFS